MLVEILLLVLGLNAAFLTWHCQYEDGLLGRVALASIVLGVVIVLVGQWTEHVTYEFSLETLLILGGFTVFLARHTWRWNWRRRIGPGAWRGNKHDRREVS